MNKDTQLIYEIYVEEGILDDISLYSDRVKQWISQNKRKVATVGVAVALATAGLGTWLLDEPDQTNKPQITIPHLEHIPFEDTDALGQLLLKYSKQVTNMEASLGGDMRALVHVIDAIKWKNQPGNDQFSGSYSGPEVAYYLAQGKTKAVRLMVEEPSYTDDEKYFLQEVWIKAAEANEDLAKQKLLRYLQQKNR